MNGRPNIPPVAPLVFIGLAVLALKALFSSEAEKKPETAPATPGRKPSPIPLNSAGNGCIPHYSAGKISAPPVPASVPVVSAASAVLPIAGSLPVRQPVPGKGRTITREDLAVIFNGARGLTRTAAVSALKAVGFGKTAAYAALSPDGRFSAWLQCAPDGIITWNDK
jgi:hypothetical protein